MDRINGADFIDIGGGRRGFRSEDLTLGVPGTEVTALWLNMIQEEILKIMEVAGVNPSEADWSQLAKAIQSQKLNYTVAGGTPNALTAVMVPAVAAYSSGLEVNVLIAATNTAGATLSLNGLPALPIRTLSGSSITQGDLIAGAVMGFICTGTAWLLRGLAYSETIRPLRSDVALYVRPDGNDANDGSANTPAKAFRRIQAAIDYARQRFATVGFTITVNVADGSYDEFALIEGSGCRMRVVGNTAAPQNVVVTAGAGLAGATSRRNSTLMVAGLTFTGGAHNLLAEDRSSIEHSNCRFGPVSGYQVYATQSSTIKALTSYEIFGGGLAHLVSSSNSTIEVLGRNLSYVGALSYTTANVWANNSTIILTGSNFYSGSGTVSGVRYLADLSGLIFTQFAGANFISGSAAGQVSSGGIYT